VTLLSKQLINVTPSRVERGDVQDEQIWKGVEIEPSFSTYIWLEDDGRAYRPTEHPSTIHMKPAHTKKNRKKFIQSATNSKFDGRRGKIAGRDGTDFA